MEDLDAELLAVTGDPQKRPARASLSDGSDSGGEFGGIADSAAEDDDDDAMLESAGPGDDDDDDDDDDFGLDDSADDDYAAKRKPRPRKKAAPKHKKGRGKRKPAPRKAPIMPSDDDDEGDAFEYRYDEDGYGDAADRDRLQRMNEIDRETLLTERVEARAKEFEMWKMRREILARDAGTHKSSRTARSSGRSKSSSKSDALQALAEDKRKKTSRALDDVSDADSEVERKPRGEQGEAREEPDLMQDHEGPELQFADLVTFDESRKGAKTTPLFLRRDNLIELSQLPYFARFVVGLYVRVRGSGSRPRDDGSYVLCRIAGVETGKVYQLNSKYSTNWYLLLQSGKQKIPFGIHLCSSSSVTEREFDVYRSLAIGAGVELPRREEVEKLLKRMHELFVDRKVTATDAENRQHIANMETVYPARVNWTQKRTEVRMTLDIRKQELVVAKNAGDVDREETLAKQVDELQNRMREISANEAKYGTKVAARDEQVFQNVAKRNHALNTSDGKLIAMRQNLETEAGGIDPYARFDTTGQSYFSIKRKGEKQDEKSPANVAKHSGVDWRSCLVTQRAGGTKRRISETPFDPSYGDPIMGLDDFTREFSDPQGDGKKTKMEPPPGIDAMYNDLRRTHVKLPADAKIISFETYMKTKAL